MGKMGETIATGLAAAAMATGTPSQAETLPEGLDLVRSQNDPFAGKTTEQKIQEMADREEIRQLIHLYAHRAAVGISISDLFTDDSALIVHRPGEKEIVSRGRKAVDATFAAIAKNPGAQLPMIHNSVLRIAGDDATGICSIEVRGNNDGQNVIGSAYYSDRFRRVNGRWKFVKREVNFFHYTTLEKGWVTKPAKQ